MIVVLGSTGSIGVNTLVVAKQFDIKIEALVGGENIDLLNEQIEIFSPLYVGIKNESQKHLINHQNVFCGAQGLLELLKLSKSPLVVNALVGYIGLAPTLEAIKLGKKVALANKESLVVAGQFIDTKQIIPIDSEHFGLWYLQNRRHFSKLYITASGGALRDWSLEDMQKATFAEALKHPNWSMGDKITIDSATMTNKLFELLEAKWLFDTNHIDAYIEKKSLVHALIEFTDGSTTAHFARPNMQLPIAFALQGEVRQPLLEPLDLGKIGSIEFTPISTQRYPIWEIKEHLIENPHLGVVLNAANEEAIGIFKKNGCSFFEMSQIVLDAYQYFEDVSPRDIGDIIDIDTQVRRYLAR